MQPLLFKKTKIMNSCVFSLPLAKIDWEWHPQDHKFLSCLSVSSSKSSGGTGKASNSVFFYHNSFSNVFFLNYLHAFFFFLHFID